jgi:hypothetical protein
LHHKSRSLGHVRAGLSDLMATVLLVAMTLIAGAALFGYVNGQAANSENAVGASNQANVNFLNERFVVVDMAINSVGPSADIWIYNNGNLNLNLEQISLYQASDKQAFYIVFGNGPSSGGCGSASSPGFGTATYLKSGTSTPFVFGSSGTQIPMGSSPIEITLQLPTGCSGFASSTTYDFNVLGLYGNIIVAQCDSVNGVCAN